MPGFAGINIKGDKELERAFRQMRKEVLAEMRPELRRIGEIVRADAEQRAFGQITNIGSQWGQMRLGVVAKGVYVAPKTRNQGGPPRKNLAGKLMDQAMQPALDANEDKVVHEFEVLLDVTAAKNGFLGV